MASMDTLSGGSIEPRGLEEEMRSSYLDYAMSVIVGRARPDVRDGLKPVHRRVLFSMHESGLQPNRPYRKCANVVGGVMGNFHPHGDQAIYDTLVRLAQDFAQRYPLVDGQGNFGSIDNDPAAAMRYTEARLARLATELLRDIDADTVDFRANYDDSRLEPIVLPSRFPNLLVNGSAGIAVGMATNIPPHNLGEVVDAVNAYIDDPEIDVAGLMQHVKGPDFPTGGSILGRGGIREAYETGRGRVLVRGRAHIEPLKQGKHYVDHQREVVVRRTKFELRQAEDRAHILEGLLVALDNLDEVIALIRGSRDPEAAREGLQEKFGLSEIQAHAIVEMRLRQLTALEAGKIKREHSDLMERIRELREILGDEGRVMALVKEDLGEIRERFSDERRTEITASEDELDIEDLIADQQMVVAITKSGYVKSLPLATYRQQKRGGIGVTGMDLKEDDYVEHLFVCSTHDFLLFFTNRGKVYRQKVYELPEASRTAKGRALVNI